MNFLWIFLGIILGGCMAPRMPVASGPHYLQKLPLALAVGSIEVINPDTGSPSKKGGLSISLPEMVQQWSREHLQAVGSRGVLRITVQEASVSEIPLRSRPDPLRLLHVEHIEQNKGRLRLCFEWIPPGQSHPADQAIISIEGENYVPENYRVQERRALLLCLYEDLLNRLSYEADRVLPALTTKNPRSL